MATKVQINIPNTANMVQMALANSIQEVGFKCQEIAVANAPKDTGYYSNNIKYDGKKEVVAHANYSAAIEYGIKNPVIIKPKNAKALRFVVNGEEIFAKSVQQKTRAPNPVMRNAARQTQKEVDRIFKKNLAKVK